MEGRHAGLKLVTPQLIYRDETLVMGVEVRTTAQKERDSETSEIPKLWNRFWAEQLWLDIPDAINPDAFYGVYTDYDSDPFGPYSLILATEVSSIDNPPESMVGLVLSAGRYLVFGAPGALPEAVARTWQQIGDYFAANPRYQRTYTTDFELYEPQQVNIYIAVK